VDNQLRGRSAARDPGGSRFVISLEDDLMPHLRGDRNPPHDGQTAHRRRRPIEHSLISRSVEGLRRKVEERNFQIRKHVLEYDDVMNLRAEVIYGSGSASSPEKTCCEDVLDIIERILRAEVATFAVARASQRSGTWRSY